ncbi:hypothetical protein ACOMHN_011278 [Nucella lapillus]
MFALRRLLCGFFNLLSPTGPFIHHSTTSASANADTSEQMKDLTRDSSSAATSPVDQLLRPASATNLSSTTTPMADSNDLPLEELASESVLGAMFHQKGFFLREAEERSDSADTGVDRNDEPSGLPGST